jgi:hypothetical protein
MIPVARAPANRFADAAMPNLLRALWLGAALGTAVAARAQTDEIQVYDATIAEPGSAELTVHNNYTPNGRKAPDFAGGVTPDRSLNGTFEFAYGCADFWELGLYMPVYTLTNQGALDYEGAKLRTLFVVPHARTREFFYGVNFEFSYNLPRWSPTRTGLEVRPIVGWHEGTWDFILNPIVDSDFDGLGRAHFEPAERIAYNASSRWTFALEEYADLGRLRRFDALSQESQSLFLVIDYTASGNNSFEFGAGFGLTGESDRLVLKLIWNHAL